MLAQPFGSPSDVIGSEIAEGKTIVDAQGKALLELVDGIVASGKTLGAISKAITKAGKQQKHQELAKVLYRASLKAAMLGADDAHFEADEDEVVTPEKFTRCPLTLLLLDAGPAPDATRSQSFVDAIKAFRRRKSVTKDVFEAMVKAARLHAFTIARLTSARTIGIVQEEIADYLDAPSQNGLAGFLGRLRKRLDQAGVTIPEAEEIDALKPSHVETIFRNNVMSSYAEGRRSQMTQPAVIAARPYWQVMTVKDGPPRQRPTHAKIHGWVMLADDLGWKATAPPFGHNCRCRVVSRSAKWVKSNSPHIHKGAFPNLPDPGWST